MSDLDRRLAAVAADQHMLITLRDLRGAGGDAHHAHRRVMGGRWTPVDRGVWLLTGAPQTWEARQLSAVLAAGPGAVTSHLAAARLWGIDGFGRAGVEITIPRGRRYRREGIRTHESTDLNRCSMAVRSGIPVTDADRTVLDLGRYLGVPKLARVAESARREGLVNWSSLIATLSRHARRGRHGTRRLRAVILANADRAEVTDSDLELLVLSLLVDAGLPTPVVHHEVTDHGRFVGEVDLAYPQWRIALECDGAIHLVDEVRQRDIAKHNDLTLCGWTVLRVTWKRLHERPDLVVAEVRDAIFTARRAVVGRPQ